MFKEDKNLHRSGKSQGLGDALMKWWKVRSHNLAYKLLYMARHGDKNEQYKALTVLGSLSYLKSMLFVYIL